MFTKTLINAYLKYFEVQFYPDKGLLNFLTAAETDSFPINASCYSGLQKTV